MLTFLANSRDGSTSSAATCGSCCCESATARPGETNKWVINYSSWVAPIGGRGLLGVPAYTFTKTTKPVTTTPANRPPTNTDYTFTTAINTALASTVATNGADPEGQALTFAILPLYGPAYGTIVFNADGTFTYTPQSNWYGRDEFFFSTSDSVNLPVVNKAFVTVNPAAPIPALPAPPPHQILSIDPLQVSVTGSILEFPLAVSPAAVPGDVYRLDLLMTAQDCSGTTFRHQSCFDIVIGKC